MKIAAVFFLSVGLALARGDTTPDKVNQLEAKNVIKAPTLETASTRTGEVQVSHMQYQANRMDDQHFQQHPQQNQFYSQSQAPHGHSQELSQHYQDQNFPSTYSNQDQSQSQTFHLQEQNLAGSSAHSGQEIPSLLQSSQRKMFHLQEQNLAGSSAQSGQEIPSLLQSSQRITPPTISSFQDQSNEQVRDFPAREHYSTDIHSQQEFYQYGGGIQDVQGQHGDRKFDDPSNNQIASRFPSSGIRTGYFPKVYHQRSAFDNREQPIVLPGVTQTHSTSVIVSGGLKNLPVLPALVYSSGAVPATHAVAYSRPWFQGGAYVKQHWQTPYARYVYSHVL